MRTLKEIMKEPIDLVELSALVNEKGPLCICGEPLTGDVRYIDYKDQADYLVQQIGKRVWLYVHCNNCRYDMALWKIKSELQ